MNGRALGCLGTLALVSVVVTLASAARRRRREVAVLRSLGLARDQLRRLVADIPFVLLVARESNLWFIRTAADAGK
jgi:predicted lysophospholipase L1 biosynthesis ABC-type transport system permease subunit